MNLWKAKKDRTQVKYVLKNVISTCVDVLIFNKTLGEAVFMESLLNYSNLWMNMQAQSLK